MKINVQAQCDGDGCDRRAHVAFDVANDGFAALDATSVPLAWRYDGTTLMCRECCGAEDRVLTAAEGLTPNAIAADMPVDEPVEAPSAHKPKKGKKGC